MIRRLFAILSALSLLLCATACVLWVRGYSHEDMVQWHYGWYPQTHLWNSRWFAIQSYPGTIKFGVVRNDFDLSHPQARFGAAERFREENPIGLHWEVHSTRIEGPYPPSWIGFHATHEDSAEPGVSSMGPGRHDEYWYLSARPWLPIALLAVLPSIWLHRYRLARLAKRPGLCPSCGYDLRATPDRCPECGTAAERTA